MDKKTKSFITCLMLLTCCLFIHADKYCVNAESGLNIRDYPGTSGQIIGKLDYQSVIDIETQDNGWAKFQLNGTDAYVNTKYLTPYSDDIHPKDKQQSWSFWHWLFTHDKFTIFTFFKWILIISIGFLLVRFALMIGIAILSGGLVFGGFTLMACFLLKWFGIIETDTMWTVSKWAFNIGLVFGVFFALTHLGDLFNEALDTGTSSSSSGSSGSSSSGGSDWESEHGTMFKNAHGNSYIVDGNSKTHWINSHYNDLATDDKGNEWHVIGNNARKIKR